MFLAGVDVPDNLVLRLAATMRDEHGLAETADRLETAYEQEIVTLGLYPDERQEILVALDEANDAPLAQLRAVLLQESVARDRGSGA